MSEQEPQNGVPIPGAPAAYNIGLKLLFVAISVIAFLIPIFVIWGLNMERSERARQAASEVAESWAGSLELSTPYLVVPYLNQYYNSDKKPYTIRDFIAVFPESQEVTGTVDSSVRYKGIYPVPLFSTTLANNLVFKKPGNGVFGDELFRIEWDAAAVVYPVPFFSSLSGPIEGTWGTGKLTFDRPSPEMHLRGEVLAAKVDLSAWEGEEKVSLTLPLRGTSGISFIPFAKTNKLHLESTWSSPSFNGSALPETREISDRGFSATWSTVSYATNQAVGISKEDSDANLYSVWEKGHNSDSRFGVDFFQPLSIYQTMDRALKYSILFIVIPFVALFLFEMTLRLRIHLVQYLLVGLADLLFFLLLLSLSEQIAFDVAYIVSSLAVVVLVTWYVAQVLGSGARAFIMSGILVLLYGYMFAALRSEDYALIIGAVGLFAIVATVMVFTRKIDWYAMGRQGRE